MGQWVRVELERGGQCGHVSPSPSFSAGPLKFKFLPSNFTSNLKKSSKTGRKFARVKTGQSKI